MNNLAIARVFSRIADLMEIKGENPFKVRAYRNAARAMQELTESPQVLAERGELVSIPGVGEAIEQKTRDILATGTTKLYERLKAEVPESLIELLDIPSFGPKKVNTVWQKLGVRDLDELEKAAAQHRLADLPGFTARSEEKLPASIAAVRRRRERRPYEDAVRYAEAFARMLLDTGAFERVEIAGSLRRKQDMVGDVDLAAAAADPTAALDAFVRLPELRELFEREGNRASAVTHEGMRVELFIVEPVHFEAAWEHYTGSREHNEQVALVRQSGAPIARGLVLESGGLASMPSIPPELREGRGEVEAALERRLPRLITGGDIRGILHAHTTWSDGLGSVAAMAAAARERGYAYLAITDHSKALGITRGLDEGRLAEQGQEIEAVNATFDDGFALLKGIECDILADGELDLAREVLEGLDFVIGSIHMRHGQDEEAMTRRIVRALESGLVNLLAHPTGRILGWRDPYAVDMERVMDAALANGVAMEINAFPDRLDMDETHARRAMEKGLRISVNPDAHRPQQLEFMRYGIAQARRAWLEPEHVINCWSLERLRDWLRRGR